MRLEDFTARATRVAAQVGHQAKRPAIEAVAKERTRRRVLAWGSLIGIALLSASLGLSRGPAQTPVATAISTSTTTTSTPSTTLGQASCPVTVPGTTPFEPVSATPPGPPESLASVWFGSPALWTRLGVDGETWDQLPTTPDGTLTQNTFWWREGFSQSEEPNPEIVITLERLGSGEPIEPTTRTTSGGNPELGQFMIAQIQIPDSGCWEITGSYRGQSLSYVAWVGEGQS